MWSHSVRVFGARTRNQILVSPWETALLISVDGHICSPAVPCKTQMPPGPGPKSSGCPVVGSHLQWFELLFNLSTPLTSGNYCPAMTETTNL